MKQLFAVLILIAAGCSSPPKAKDTTIYGDNFLIGCVNGHLHYKSFKEPDTFDVKDAFDWCRLQYKKVVYGPGVEK